MRQERTSRLVAVAALTFALSLTAPASAVVPAPPTRATSYTALALYPAPVFRTPGAGRIGRLASATQWSQAQAAYLITATRVVDGRRWVRLLLPGRPNGRQGWVAADDVAVRRIARWIRVSRATRTVTVFVGGKVRKRFRAAVGAAATPTPTGLAAIQDSVPTSGLLGPHILVLTAHSTVLKTFAGGQGEVAIHGWPSGDVLGKAVSNGCVRLTRDAVTFVSRFATPGTPVEVV